VLSSPKLKDFAFVVVLCVISPTIAEAVPTFQVNSTADEADSDVSDGICRTASGTCTLRAAIMQANAEGSVGALINVPAGTYLLTRPVIGGGDGDSAGNLNVTSNGAMTLVGAGAATTIVDAGQIDSVLKTDASAKVTIRGMTFRGGAPANGNDGYGIQNAGTLRIEDSVITESVGRNGGCIQNSGALTIVRVTLSHCEGGTGGGGLRNVSGANTQATIIDSTITANTAVEGSGGGIQSFDAPLLVTGSTISYNHALYGGGVYASDNIVIVNSTIAANDADLSGGGLFAAANTTALHIRVFNSTIVDNYDDTTHDDGGGLGGGIYVADNASYSVDLYNSIVANNQSIGNREIDDCYGAIAAYANNYFGDLTGCTVLQQSGQTKLLNNIGLLGDLANNGGPTQTVALLAGVNAIDGGGNCVDQNGAALTTDQRGYLRPFGLHCDAGAYEYSDIVFRNGFE
jgi:CSLREA domain-containing protein